MINKGFNMAKKNEEFKRPPKPPVTRFSDGLASGKYQIITDPQEVKELLATQRNNTGGSRKSDLPTYSQG
jgi:hypothetical protein